jgi:hypothetical protein
MRSVAPSDRSIDRTLFVRFSLATASIAAGLVHAAVVPHHLEDGDPRRCIRRDGDIPDLLGGGGLGPT